MDAFEELKTLIESLKTEKKTYPFNSNQGTKILTIFLHFEESLMFLLKAHAFQISEELNMTINPMIIRDKSNNLQNPKLTVRACSDNKNDIEELFESLSSYKNDLRTEIIPLNPQAQKEIEREFQNIQQQYGVGLKIHDGKLAISGIKESSKIFSRFLFLLIILSK